MLAPAGEPALLHQELRQNTALKGALRLILEQARNAMREDQRHQLPPPAAQGLQPGRRLRFFAKQEPEEAVGPERHEVRQLSYGRESRAAQHLDRYPALEAREIEFHRLSGSREIRHAEDRFGPVLSHIGEDLAVAGIKEGQGAAAEALIDLA